MIKVPIESLYFILDEAGQPLRPGGEVGPTTELRQSLQVRGQLQAIATTQQDWNGCYGIINGHSRWTALKSLGLTECWIEPIAVAADDIQTVTRLMAASTIQKRLDIVSLGETMQHYLNLGWTLEDCSKEFSTAPDDVLALLKLASPNTPESVRREARAGHLALTTWKTRLARLSEVRPDLVEDIIEEARKKTSGKKRSRGAISASTIRDVMREMEPEEQQRIAPDAEVVPSLMVARTQIDEALRLRSDYTPATRERVLVLLEQLVVRIQASIDALILDQAEEVEA